MKKSLTLSFLAIPMLLLLAAPVQALPRLDAIRMDKTTQQAPTTQEPRRMDDDMDDDMRRGYDDDDRPALELRQIEPVRMEVKEASRATLLQRIRYVHREGADFSVNEDGQVVITTPSGEEHVLNHLPEVAIEKMTAAGFFIDDEEDIQVNATDSAYFFHTRADDDRRLLGIFPRRVPVDVTLDDESGEITQQPIAERGFFARFLDRLSF